MTPKSITPYASTAFGRLALGVKTTLQDAVHLSDLWRKRVAADGQGMRIPGGCQCFLRVGEIERNGPNPKRSRQSRKTRLFGRTLRDFLLNVQVASLGVKS